MGVTPTSSRAILHHKDAILCTFLHTTVPYSAISTPRLALLESLHIHVQKYIPLSFAPLAFVGW